MPPEHVSPSAAAKPEDSSAGWQPPSVAEIQARLHGYKVTKFIARGGMGAVYRGEQISLGRQVAIKILPPQLRNMDPLYAQRFAQEARAMAQLNHPGIVSVHDFGEMADGTLFFIMEFIDGTDVARMVEEQGRLPSAHAMAITAHVCDALQYAHERGLVHRDIKPANIMVGYDGRVKVADFGLAKSVRQANTSLTISGHVMGTPHFVAPEALALGLEVDHRADIYAVGVMLYQMLTGKLPQGVFEMPSKQVSGLDPRYDDIVTTAMREDRDKRFQRIRDMRRALDAILTKPVAQVRAQDSQPAAALPTMARPQRPPRPPQPPAPSPKKKSSALMWMFVAVVVLGFVAFFPIHRPEQSGATAPIQEPTVAANAPPVSSPPPKPVENKPPATQLSLTTPSPAPAPPSRPAVIATPPPSPPAAVMSPPAQKTKHEEFQFKAGDYLRTVFLPLGITPAADPAAELSRWRDELLAEGKTKPEDQRDSYRAAYFLAAALAAAAQERQNARDAQMWEARSKALRPFAEDLHTKLRLTEQKP